MTREQTKWTAFIGQEIAAQVAKRKPHAEAIRVAYETARREYKKTHPEIHVLPDFLKEIDSFQRANKGHRGAMPIAQWPTHKKNPAKKKKRKAVKKKARSVSVVGVKKRTAIKKLRKSFYLVGTVNEGKRYYFVGFSKFTLNKNGTVATYDTVSRAQTAAKNLADKFYRQMFVEGPLF